MATVHVVMLVLMLAWEWSAGMYRTVCHRQRCSLRVRRIHCSLYLVSLLWQCWCKGRVLVGVWLAVSVRAKALTAMVVWQKGKRQSTPPPQQR